MSLKNDNVIDGKAIAQQCREDTAKEVAALKARYGKVHSNHEAAPSMY
jgi:5,10-methylene-tetrahydrofolate dehydrogenase/methenyl tetrahydrofolate cyclohydrolase